MTILILILFFFLLTKYNNKSDLTKNEKIIKKILQILLLTPYIVYSVICLFYILLFLIIVWFLIQYSLFGEPYISSCGHAVGCGCP